MDGDTRCLESTIKRRPSDGIERIGIERNSQRDGPYTSNNSGCTEGRSAFAFGLFARFARFGSFANRAFGNSNGTRLLPFEQSQRRI